jgi:L-asparaginase/Glu-tRNA(Gln) amidotransferase subunit D
LPLRILRLPGGVEVHQMGEASQGISKFLSKETRLLIIYTGGTMGMKPDANGALAPVPGYLTEQIALLVDSHKSDPLPTVTSTS